MPAAWDLPNAAWASLYAARAAVFAWLLWLGMKNHGSLERGAKRVLKQVAALGAVAVVAMLAFAAADRAEAPAPRRSFDEQIRTRIALEVRAFPSRFRDTWRESGTAAARRKREHRRTGRNALTGTVLALLHTPPMENLDEEDHGPHRLRAVSVGHERSGTSSAGARRLGVRPAGL
jgi:hypothetical protein